MIKLFGVENVKDFDNKNKFQLFKKILNYYVENYEELNNIQNQCISSIYNNNDSIFIGAAVGSGKTQITEFAIIKKLLILNDEKTDLKISQMKAPILYLCANDDIADEKYSYFSEYFTCLEINEIIKLSYFTGEFEKDKKNFQICDMIVSSFLNFDKSLAVFPLFILISSSL